MRKSDFLRRLEAALAALPEAERRRHLDYYAELFEDMREDGMDEAEAAARLGDPEALAAAILCESPAPRRGRRPALGVLAGLALVALAVAVGLLALGRDAAAVPTPAPTPSPTPGLGASVGAWVDGLLDDVGAGLEGLGDALEEALGRVSSPELGGYRDWTNAYAADGAYAVPAGDVDALELRWLAGEAVLRLYDGDEIAFRETDAGGDAVPESDALRWGLEDGRLYVQYCAPGRADLPEKRLELLLPAQLEELALYAASADLRLEGLTAARLDVAGVSGEVELAGCGAGELSVATVSGDMELGVVCERLALATTSGDIAAGAGFEAGRVEAATVSGRIGLAGRVGEAELETTSGAVSLALDACPDALDVETVSGAVRLALPAGSGFRLRYDSVSGRLSGGFPLEADGGDYVAGDGDADLRVETTSGSLTVDEA